MNGLEVTVNGLEATVNGLEATVNGLEATVNGLVEGMKTLKAANAKGVLKVKSDRELKRQAGDRLLCIFFTGYRYIFPLFYLSF